MKKILVLAAVCALLVGCNTIGGVGKDIKKSGEVIEKAAAK